MPAQTVFAEAIFISDLHLHPKQPDITQKFFAFCAWVKNRTNKLYILGDFLHAWPGDDALDAWSMEIINALADLANHGILIYFMPGNRDFLIGNKFLKLAKLIKLTEPSVVKLGENKVLLVHGDCYCTADKAHQWLRRFTRNWWFKFIFMQIPYRFRRGIVSKVRSYSENKKPAIDMQNIAKLQTNSLLMSKDLRKLKIDTVIHGHTHIPGLTTHTDLDGEFFQYVLSDWDANPLILCYNKTNKFYYKRFVGSDK